MGKHRRPRSPQCAKCRAGYPVHLVPAGRGWLCAKCVDWHCERGDATAKALRAELEGQGLWVDLQRNPGVADPEAKANLVKAVKDYDEKALAVKQRPPAARVSLGEVVPEPGWLADTLAVPGLAAIDASNRRMELLLRHGTDCAALAIDAADSAGAENSLEKMLCHQLAVAHKTAMEIIDKSLFEQEPTDKARLLLVAARFLDTYQRGMLTLQRIKTGGDQRIVVHHVDVRDGGQALIGNVSTGGKNSK